MRASTDKVGRAFRKGAGCQQCHDSGFHGRFGIYEVMEVTPELRRMIHKAAPSHELREELPRGAAGRCVKKAFCWRSKAGAASTRCCASRTATKTWT